jgi:hypothetical protein
MIRVPVAAACILLLRASQQNARAQSADSPIPQGLLLALIETASGNSIPSLRVGEASDGLPSGLLSGDMTILGSVSSTFRAATVATVALPVTAARDSMLARASAAGFIPGPRPASGRAPPSAGPGGYGPAVFC